MKHNTDIQYIYDIDNDTPLSDVELDRIADIFAEWIYRYMTSQSMKPNTIVKETKDE